MPDIDWHEIHHLSGIGPATTASLNAAGFHFAEDLLRRPPLALAQDLEYIDGLTIENIMQDLIPQARLMRLPELASNQADKLASAHFNYGRIAYSDSSRIMNVLPSLSDLEVARIQLDAAKRLNSATTMVRVLNLEGDPIAGADVFIGDPPATGEHVSWRFETNQFGESLVEYLAPGFHRFMAPFEDRWGEAPLILRSNEYCTLIIQLTRTSPNGITYDEETSGPIADRGSSITVDRDLSELAEGTLLQVLSDDENTIHLAGFHRQRLGANWITIETTAPSSAFVNDAVAANQVWKKTHDTLVKAADDAHSLREAIRRQRALIALSQRLGGI